MAEFLVKVADEQGHLVQQVEHGYSEADVRERFTQQGYLVYWVKPQGIFSGGKVGLSRGKTQAKSVRNFQPAVSDPDQSWSSDPDCARIAYQEAERRHPAAAA